LSPAIYKPGLEKTRKRIAKLVRELRTQRGWTQRELARILEMSQGRLSQLERGAGSFAAEQLLLLMRTFNVPASHFAGDEPGDLHTELQNTLARLGAVHLHESTDAVPTELFKDAAVAVGEALALGIPRLVTAIGPVIVTHVDRIQLSRVQLDLAKAGLERRWFWLIDNVLEAVRAELGSSLSRAWIQRYRRAEIQFSTFLEAVPQPGDGEQPSDILDPGIRSQKTLDEVKKARSPLARRWAIITSLAPADFSRALEAARVGD
jgi:transcriptional regulator with XRE-family HTH domain